MKKIQYFTESEWKSLNDILIEGIPSPEALDRVIERISKQESGRIQFHKEYFNGFYEARKKPSSSSEPTSSNEISRPLNRKEIMFGKVVPFMQKVALKYDRLFEEGVPVLADNGEIELSVEQVACLVAHLYFCTLVGHKSMEGFQFAKDHSIVLLLQGKMVQKMECLMNYFEMVSKEVEENPKRKVIYGRRSLAEFPEWDKSDKLIQKVVTYPKGTIESSSAEYHIDFAFEIIGGGVLAWGNVQEELLFLMKPECLAGMLMLPKMMNNEAIAITGAKHFNEIVGYGNSFKFGGPSTHVAPWNESRSCLQGTVIAIDAVVAVFGQAQFTNAPFIRDLNKAYCGFSYDSDRKDISIATGNWGCGAFGGNLYLKAFQQIIAASETQRELHYYTFQKPGLDESINTFVSLAQSKKLTVSKLYADYMTMLSKEEMPMDNVLAYLIKLYQ